MKASVSMAARRALGRLLGPIARSIGPLNHAARRAQLFDELGVDLLLDVGANIGQYAAQLRLYGYRGALHSYEPLSSAFTELTRHAAGDARWTPHRAGLGRERGTATLHVSGNSQSSSLRKMLPRHLESAPESVVVGTETVSVITLADALDDVGAARHRTFLKIDAQGSERDILEGSEASLEALVGLELELSLVPLYEGETLFAEMVAWLDGRGFALRGLTNGLVDPKSGAVQQVDALFARRG